MRVLNPLALARRRQICGTPVPRAETPHGEDSAEIFDLREERRSFAEPDAPHAPQPPSAG
jgi:hypothetical protein